MSDPYDSAFPVNPDFCENYNFNEAISGLTKFEYFAIHAMHGVLANGTDLTPEQLARHCAAYAMALLAVDPR